MNKHDTQLSEVPTTELCDAQRRQLAQDAAACLNLLHTVLQVSSDRALAMTSVALEGCAYIGSPPRPQWVTPPLQQDGSQTHAYRLDRDTTPSHEIAHRSGDDNLTDIGALDDTQLTTSALDGLSVPVDAQPPTIAANAQPSATTPNMLSMDTGKYPLSYRDVAALPPDLPSRTADATRMVYVSRSAPTQQSRQFASQISRRNASPQNNSNKTRGKCGYDLIVL